MKFSSDPKKKPLRSAVTGRFILTKDQSQLYKRLSERAKNPRADLPKGI